MNIFALDHDPVQAAAWHTDLHVGKMIIESAQMLSTAHRIIDGHNVQVVTNNKHREIKLMPGEAIVNQFDEQLVVKNKRCCLATHVNHPCNIWVRESSENYQWLLALYTALAREFEHRRNKVHAAWANWNRFLQQTPKGLSSKGLTPFATAMPDKYVVADPIESYKRYYVGDKYRFAKWSKRDIPQWYMSMVPNIFHDDELESRQVYLSDPKYAGKTVIKLAHF
jgi:phage terminase large subunit-like protein